MALNPQFDPFRISIPFLSSSSQNPDKKLAFIPALPPSVQRKSEESTSPYLVTAFKLASYFGFVPFKVIKVKQSPSTKSFDYQIVPLGIVRKCFCALVHLTLTALNVSHNVNELILTDPAQFSSNFTKTFDLVTTIGMCLLSTSFVISAWLRQDQLLEIIQQTRVIYDKRTERKHQLITIAMILFSLGISLFIYMAVNPLSFLVGPWSKWWAPEPTTLDYFIKSGKLLITLFVYCCCSMQWFCSAFMVLLVLSMRGIKQTFTEQMAASLEKTDLDTGFEHYIALKQLSSNITRTFGSMILFYYIISVAYFAKIPESSVWKQNYRIVGMMGYFSFGAVVWLVAAEFHMNVRDVVQNWATQMQDLDDLPIDTRIRLLNVVNDNLLDPIGISCKFFTITYGFLGSMLGLIVTYAIIVFQMQAKPSSPTPGASANNFTKLSVRESEL